MALAIDEEDSVELTRAHQEASKLAKMRTPGEEDLAYSTQRNLKRELVGSRLIEQTRRRKHFYLSVTEAGREEARIILDKPDWGVGGSSRDADGREVPLCDVRIGKGHLLPRSEWGRMNRLVQSGEVDIVLVPHSRSTRAPYWDEA